MTKTTVRDKNTVNQDSQKKGLDLRFLFDSLKDLAGWKRGSTDGTKAFSIALQKASNFETDEVLITPEKKDPNFPPVYFYIKDGKVFIPTVAKVHKRFSGFMMEPIYQSSLDQSELTQTVKKVITAPRVAITPEKRDELYKLGRKGKHPLFKATGSTSWRNLDKNSLHYAIHTIEDETQNEMNWLVYLNEDKPNQSRELSFPIQTPVEELVNAILEDIKRYP